MPLQQVRLFLPTPPPSPEQIRSFWRLISGSPDALESVNEAMYLHVLPFLNVGSFNSPGTPFRGYRRILSQPRVTSRSVRYSTRTADPLMDWLLASPGHPQPFSVAYAYWSRFPKAYIATFLFPVEATYTAKKVLIRHQEVKEWTAHARADLQDLANQALRILECPPKLAKLGAALAKTQVKEAA